MKIRQELNAMGIDFDPVQHGGQPGGAVDLSARLLGITHRSLKLRHYVEEDRPTMPAPRTIYGSTGVIGRVPVKLAATTLTEARQWCLEHRIPFGHRHGNVVDLRPIYTNRHRLRLSNWHEKGRQN